MKRLAHFLLVVGITLWAGVANAQSSPTTLPQDHDYQKALRRYLATLTEKDFAVEIKPFVEPATPRSTEQKMRLRILLEQPPSFTEGVVQPPSIFMLNSIESAQGIKLPWIYTDGVSWLAMWNDPGNPYYNSRALKLRAFVTGAVDMIMHDDGHEKRNNGKRSDFLGGTLVWLAYAYQASADVVAPEARAAYAEGLKKMVRRLDEWGPTGQMTDMDLFAAVSMRMVSDLVNDPEITRIATSYVKRLYTDDRFFHPAGYFVDNGCFDTSYNGISLYFTVFAALNARDWAFIREALDKSYHLKSRLTFPDPDGNHYGPSQCSSRTSADCPHDQWNYPSRDVGAAMLTDHAMFLTKMPTAEQLQNATVAGLNPMLNAAAANPLPAPRVWYERHWSQNVNFAFEHYVDGYHAKRSALEAQQSPLLENPYKRKADFVDAFDNAFLIAKVGGYAAAIHTGPVSGGIFGFGGGELCAFWTPKTGSAMLGRSRGWARQTHKPETSNSFEQWRNWPVHAVTGVTQDGQVFSSSRIRDPKSSHKIDGTKRAEVSVGGVIPKDPTNTASPCLTGEVDYRRTFNISVAGVSIETSIQSDGKDVATELYETIPVFLRDANQAEAKAAKVFFQVGGAWQEATPQPQDNITAAKITRFDGAVLITFSKPARVKLSPEVWRDHYQSGVSCRAILVDLLRNNGQPQAIRKTSAAYTIAPANE